MWRRFFNLIVRRPKPLANEWITLLDMIYGSLETLLDCSFVTEIDRRLKYKGVQFTLTISRAKDDEPNAESQIVNSK